MTDWFREPEPEPDGWATHGEWLAVLGVPALVLLWTAFAMVLDAMGEL